MSRRATFNMTFETSIRLENQEYGKSLDYCVVAVNEAGEEPPKQYRHRGAVERSEIRQ